jgi:hypothetical protein
MRYARNIIAAIVVAATALAASAADNMLLIQHQPNGEFKVWHFEGETNLTDVELQTLEASAKPGGGEAIQTAAGSARAFEAEDGIIVIEVPGALHDKTLLIDRDACGGLKTWHSAGSTVLTDEQLTELVVAALPGGGKVVMLGGNRAKAYTTKLGVIAIIWPPVKRRP